MKKRNDNTDAFLYYSNLFVFYHSKDLGVIIYTYDIILSINRKKEKKRRN